MKFAINLPPFADFSSPLFLADLAVEAESAGWDGFFVWDHIMFDPSFFPIADPWVALAAVAARTQRMRLGTMITPIARRRPWVLARQTVSLDRLSQGRLTLGVGLGVPEQWEYGFFGEETDAKVRAEKLDEGLAIITGLWSAQKFSFQGKHYQLKEVVFRPTPVQQPRIPIWVGGYWPRKAPFRRAARFDGVVPGKVEGMLTPEDWREMLAFIASQRKATTPYDAVHGELLPDDSAQARRRVQEFADAGVTWWVQPVDPFSYDNNWEKPWTAAETERMLRLVRQGPPA